VSAIGSLHCDPHVLQVVEPCLETQPRESRFAAQAHILARHPRPFKINIQLAACHLCRGRLTRVDLWWRTVRTTTAIPPPLIGSCTAARQTFTLDPVVRSRHAHARGYSMRLTDACATNRGGHAVLVRTTRSLQACVGDPFSTVDASMIGSPLSMSRVSSRAKRSHVRCLQ
jgi:hypothetical protein